MAKNFSKGKTQDPQQLTPTYNELQQLQQHIKCWNYQSHVWKKALIASPDIPSPSGHGWLFRDDLLKIYWMENMPAPISVLEMLVCKCQKWACGNVRQCQILGLECTDLCKCSGSCNNETETSDIENETDDESYDISEASDAELEYEDWYKSNPLTQVIFCVLTSWF